MNKADTSPLFPKIRISYGSVDRYYMTLQLENQWGRKMEFIHIYIEPPDLLGLLAHILIPEMEVAEQQEFPLTSHWGIQKQLFNAQPDREIILKISCHDIQGNRFQFPEYRFKVQDIQQEYDGRRKLLRRR